MKLTEADLQFFSKRDSWTCGPMYDTVIFFKPGARLDGLEQLISEIDFLKAWDGAGPSLKKSIMMIDELGPVGLVQHPIHESKFRKYPGYSFSIYPPHYERVLGMSIVANSDSDKDENWHKMELLKVQLFHMALFHLVAKVNSHIEVLSTCINTEDRGFAMPYTYNGSICISPNLAAVLALECTEIPHSYGFFTEVSNPVKM